jgi:hypothetical protein
MSTIIRWFSLPYGLCRAVVYVVACVVMLLSLGCSPQGPETQDPQLQGLDFDVYRENIEPLFYQSRGDFLPPEPGDPACVMCHTWQTNTPLMLASLEESENGDVYWTEEQSRRNFEVISGLVTPGDPDNSRLLLKPLSAEAGGSPMHTGGKYWDSRSDPEWQMLAQWVRNATPVENEPVVNVDFEFFRACVQPVFFRVTVDGMACANCHNAEFARADPEESWDYISGLGLIEPGHPTQSRLLMHPLHPDAGGDYVHNGVRRWLSQDDPEWKMLAGWVNGEHVGASCPI